MLSAYEQLQAEGYLEAKPDMAHGWPSSYPKPLNTPNGKQRVGLRNPPRSYQLSQRGSQLIGYAGASPYQWGAFVPGAPDVTEFPHHIFSRIQARLSREPDIHHLIYSNAGGCTELRSALADYLRVARSVQCDPDQIIITEGIHQAIDLVSRALSDIGDPVWIEDPAYWGMRNTLRINGLNIQPMPVDADGIVPKQYPEQPPN